MERTTRDDKTAWTLAQPTTNGQKHADTWNQRGKLSRNFAPLPRSFDLIDAFQPLGRQLAMLFLFSTAVNLLLLTGPLYMLQVYDRVLTSGSIPTLVVLSAIVGFFFVIYGIIETVRIQMTARLGGRMVERLDGKVFRAVGLRLSADQGDSAAHKAHHDIEAIRTLCASSFATAVLDLLFVPIFIFLTFAFHPAIGWTAVGGTAVLILLTLVGRKITAAHLRRQFDHQSKADLISGQMRAANETVLAMGMLENARRRWEVQRRFALMAGLHAGDLTMALNGAGRAWRMALQSAILGVGAWAVLRNQMSAGAIIAASVLVGRALQPIETIMGHWPALLRAAEGWQRLSKMVETLEEEVKPTDLPRPEARLSVAGITAGPPNNYGRPILRQISFDLGQGMALGVIGPAGSGKTCLARVVTGVWPSLMGTVRLGGATLDQFDAHRRGQLIGYLPQHVTFLDGTVAENIARFDPFAMDETIIDAAIKADAHQMIMSLPKGYDTQIVAANPALSGGQLQRIALARALFGNPVLLVLDEPNSSLDAEGALALNAAIRQHKSNGGTAIITSHRPAALQECDFVLVLDAGQQTAFGPRDAVLQRHVVNHPGLRQMNVSG